MASRKSTSMLVLQIALALVLIVTGIVTVQLNGGFVGKVQSLLGGNEIANAVYKMIDNYKVANVVIMVIGICEIAAGAFLLLSLFVNIGALTSTLLIAIMIMWLVVIVLVDILGKNGIVGSAFTSGANFLAWLKVFASHLLILGAILAVKD